MIIKVKPSIGSKVTVGEIKDGYFRVTDKDNYHIQSKSLGIDTKILEEIELDFCYITMEYHGRRLITTKRYFIDHAKSHNIFNFREMVFLPISEFSLAKALRYEKDKQINSISSKDIFDIARLNDEVMLAKWIEIISTRRIKI
jgi:hypothetical protein